MTAHKGLKMSNHSQFLRIKKLVGERIIKTAARHNLREIQAEQGASSHIDPTRTRLNAVLAGEGTAEGVASEASKLLADGLLRPLRHDAVQGLEIVFGLPVASGVDKPAFFQDCLNWVELFFEVPVVSAVIHNDEAAPHMHVIMLPLFDGRMIGSRLVGNRKRLNAMQAVFNEQVGQAYGLTRQTPAKRVPVAVRRQYADSVMAEFKSNPSRLNEPAVKTALLELLVSDPMAAAQALGLDKPIGFGRAKPSPIGFGNAASEAPKKQPKKEQSLSCVGFGIPEDDFNPAPDDTASEYVRIPVDDLPPESWDSEEPASVTPDGDYFADCWDGDLGEYITDDAGSARRGIHGTRLSRCD